MIEVRPAKTEDLPVINDIYNGASIRLHARLGFQPVGAEREVGYKSNRWLDVVLMQWMVNAPAGSESRPPVR